MNGPEPIIDVHVHPFTDETIEVMPEWFWEHPREVFAIEDRDISIDQLLRDMDDAEVHRSVLLAFDCETTYGFKLSNQQVAEFVSQAPDRFVGFASVDPNKGELGIRELREAVEDLGLQGLKLHPPTQQFYPNKEQYYPLWETAQDLNLPILSHSGHTFAGGYLKYSEPKFWDDVAADFPDLDIILAHFGFPWVNQVISLGMTRDNIFIDLSGWAPSHIPDKIWTYANSLLADRFMFGTDYPGLLPQRWIQEFKSIDLKNQTKSNILGDNARRIILER